MESSTAFVAQEFSSIRLLARSFALPRPGSTSVVQAAAAQDNDIENEDVTEGLTPKESKVYELLEELYYSDLPFRIIVIGNGAILESTHALGPTFKLGQSPKTGKSIVTFASVDKSFELHLKPAEIGSVALVEKESRAKTGKTTRLLRFKDSEGGSICTLIVGSDSDSAQSWFQSMTQKYGSETAF